MQKLSSDIIKALLAITIILLCHEQAYCQKLKFEHININNGLSHNDVLQIKQDQKGYIWIGTLDGLNKYDGYQFTVYQREPYNNASLTTNAITGVWESSDGMMWVHPVTSDLNLFNPETETFSVINPLPAKDIQFNPGMLQDMEEDKEGMIWVYNWQGQLCRFDRTNNRISGEDFGVMIFNNPYNKANVDKYIRDLFKDRQGILWVGSSEGLHRVNSVPDTAGKPSRISFTHYWHNPNDAGSFPSVGNIFEDHTGKFWLGGDEGLSCFDPQTKHIIKYRHEEKNTNSLSDDRISAVAEDAQGNLWVATRSGLNRLDKDRQLFIRFYHDPTDPTSLNGNFIMTMLIDKSNTLWAGTLQSGISKVSLNYYSFPLYQHNLFNENSLSSNKVTAIGEDKEGIVWIGTLGGGLDAWNRTTHKFRHYRHNPAEPGSLFSDAIGAVFKDIQGNIWIGSGRSGTIVLSRMNAKSGSFEHHLLQYPSIGNPFAGPVFTIYQDKEGLFWIGTVNGVVTFDPVTKQSHHYPYDEKNPDGLSNSWIFSFCEDHHGNMWIGTSMRELNKLNKSTGKYTHYTYDPKLSGSISSSIVRCIYEDSKGTLWFGTFGGGLCRLNPANETFTAFTKKEGLPSNTIHSIQEDDEGNLWLGTGNGLSKFSMTSSAITNYDIKDGLQSNQFTVGTSTVGASFKGRDGTLYFGGVNGLNAFHPKYLQRNQHIPPIVINQFKLFDKVLPGKQASKEINLKYDQNFFTFEFAALDYTNSPKNQYAYMLEGFDKNWVYSGTRRFASYTGVASGKYTFYVKGSNNDGIWNERGTSIKIIIHPPWWRSNLAYTFYISGFIVLIYVIHRFQQQRILRKEQERTKEKQLQQAKEIEKAYHQLKTTQAQLIQSEKMASLGELTAGIAHEIQNPLNFVNNFSEVSNELIGEMIEEADKENTDEVKVIAKDIQQNLEKILHHGKRADAIVKGMLQHSRSSTGAKEATDINALADEYFRLSYQGLRARDKSFNATLETDFDQTIEKINIVPQDIGRVVLNLFNNAFYTVAEKKKQMSDGYEPKVSVSSKKIDARPDDLVGRGKIEIRIKDNGIGIPQKALDKIFQPFFTTKPTGQGTGLGLSLSYDIVKAHAGEIKVNTKEGEFTEFVIQLPISV